MLKKEGKNQWKAVGEKGILSGAKVLLHKLLTLQWRDLTIITLGKQSNLAPYREIICLLMRFNKKFTWIE